MIVLIILLALGALSLWAVCTCKASGEADKYMEELESRKEFEEQSICSATGVPCIRCCPGPCSNRKLYCMEITSMDRWTSETQEGYEMSEWISVKDRLPEPLEDVLVYYISGKVDIDWVNHSKMFCFENAFGCVTHWMPLPEPPKEDSQ